MLIGFGFILFFPQINSGGCRYIIKITGLNIYDFSRCIVFRILLNCVGVMPRYEAM
jgi:hypothetical protein